MHSCNLYDHILGSLTLAGIGDAIGAPTEAMSRDEIAAKYGGRITTFVDGSDNPYALGNAVGEVTDDASQMYEMALAVIRTDGELTVEAAAESILSWSRRYPRYYPRNAGPTTRHVIEELLAGRDPVQIGLTGCEYNRGVSNGAAMRIAATGLAHPGNWEKAARTAITSCRPFHGTQHAFAGACAIACAIACGIAEALTPGAQISGVLRACLWGARTGQQVGEETARRACGVDTREQILRAIRIAYDCTDMEQTERALERAIGNDGSMQTSVAVSIGLFLAADGDPAKTVLGGANIGGDTDTIACIAGSLAGAWAGYEAIPADWRTLFEKVNPALDFRQAARDLERIAREAGGSHV